MLSLHNSASLDALEIVSLIFTIILKVNSTIFQKISIKDHKRF